MAGAYNAIDNQALPSLGDSNAAPGEVGAFIGAQNAALNFGAAAAAPEPATWTLMLIGLGGIGASLINRRRPSSAPGPWRQAGLDPLHPRRW